MNLITVIPLTRSKVAETLTYFTAADVPLGAIVSVPLRSKQIHAIVLESRPAEDLKTEIKKAPYEIRKLARVRASAFFPVAFMETARRLSDQYATTPGAIIQALVSETLLENANKLPPPLPPQNDLWNETRTGLSHNRNASEIHLIQGDDTDRLSSWRSMIRQEFARKKSIALYVPTIEDARSLFNSLEKGIEGYIFTLHHGLPPKKIVENWKTIAETDHPVVIIATGAFILLPRADISSVIIERENSRGWIGQKTPYLDIRHAIEEYSRDSGHSFYIADSMLRTETLHRLEHAPARTHIMEGSPFKWRSISLAKDILVDMRNKEEGGKSKEVRNTSDENSAEKEQPRFRVLSPELEDLIQKNREDNSHLFILASRRGLSPSTVCADCQSIVTCNKCSAPVVLHTSKDTGKNFFMCHKCGERRTAREVCTYCGSWRLTPLGIGIDRVAEDIRALAPDVDLFKIDADSTKTDKQVSDILTKWQSKPGSILLGTEMTLVHLSDRTIEHVAIASLDSLLALPDFRIQEKIMYLLVRLRSIASRTFLVQTRRAEEKIFEYGLKGNLSDFFRSTLAERAQFGYPPFGTLIKVTLEGKKDQIAARMGEIRAHLEPHELDIFPAFTATVRGNSVIHGLIKIEIGKWPDIELITRLRDLPPGVSVKVNPESLL